LFVLLCGFVKSNICSKWWIENIFHFIFSVRVYAVSLVNISLILTCNTLTWFYKLWLLWAFGNNTLKTILWLDIKLLTISTKTFFNHLLPLTAFILQAFSLVLWHPGILPTFLAIAVQQYDWINFAFLNTFIPKDIWLWELAVLTNITKRHYLIGSALFPLDRNDNDYSNNNY
jgi:hypothetical protein